MRLLTFVIEAMAYGAVIVLMLMAGIGPTDPKFWGVGAAMAVVTAMAEVRGMLKGPGELRRPTGSGR